ncbi:UNVERIFIED_CONTAM: hypothetical protein PYX00_011287 [Menopon gallinae]|uniref:cyclin-dependent kinase n=1 Tax=Menopon gallinae TaxID=328185 RepID=A0AAW2H777_9NEOP
MADSYHKIEKIGEGTYGVVYKAREKRTGRIVALKKIRLNDENEGVPATTIREVSLLKTLKHSTIVNLETVLYKENKMYLAMEYLDLDLRKYIDGVRRSNKTVPGDVLRRFVQQILTAVDYCHSRAVLHRDLKPQNILVGRDMRLKLADFGLGRSIGIPLRTYTHDIITLWYRPPELLLGAKHYSEAVDVWSAAAIVAELVLLVPMFQGDSEVDQIYKIFKVLGTPSESTWTGMRDLPGFSMDLPRWGGVNLRELLRCCDELTDMIARMLAYNPAERLSARRALRHEYLRGLEPIRE